MFYRLFTFLYSIYIVTKLKQSGPKLRINPRLNSFQDLKNVIIGGNFRSMGILQIYANNGEVIIGNNCSLNLNVQIGAGDGSIVIGNDVLIGPNTVLRSSVHNYMNREKKINQQGHKQGKIVIENNVWISSNCVISGDLIIGEGSVIGAGSFLNKSVEPFSFYAGNPAKKIASL